MNLKKKKKERHAIILISWLWIKRKTREVGQLDRWKWNLWPRGREETVHCNCKKLTKKKRKLLATWVRLCIPFTFRLFLEIYMQTWVQFRQLLIFSFSNWLIKRREDTNSKKKGHVMSLMMSQWIKKMIMEV